MRVSVSTPRAFITAVPDGMPINAKPTEVQQCQRPEMLVRVLMSTQVTREARPGVGMNNGNNELLDTLPPLLFAVRVAWHAAPFPSNSGM